jgi:hypothetical protein
MLLEQLRLMQILISGDITLEAFDEIGSWCCSERVSFSGKTDDDRKNL